MGVVFTIGAFAYWGLGALGHTPYAFIVLAGLVFFTWGEIFSLFPAIATDTYGITYATANAGLLYTAKGDGGLGGAACEHHQEYYRQLVLGLCLCRGYEPLGRCTCIFCSQANAAANYDSCLIRRPRVRSWLARRVSEGKTENSCPMHEQIFGLADSVL